MPTLATTRVEEREALGRVLVACVSFPTGARLLCEPPLLSWPAGDSGAYLRALCAADAATRRAVLDMFHPRLDSRAAAVAELRAEAAELLVREGGARAEAEAEAERATLPAFCDEEMALRALLVAKLNAHSRDGGKEMALFEKASKVAHSCNPNAAYSSRDVPGKLVYKAIRPIEEGEQITFSYIGDLWSTPTAARREILLDTKLFTCHCQRCEEPDPLRALFYPNDPDHVMQPTGTSRPSADGSALEESWACSTEACGKIAAEDFERAKRSEAMTAGMLQNAAGMAFVADSLEVPTDVEAAIAQLPRTHATAIQGQHLLAMILQSRADDAKNAGDAREGGLWVRAAEARMDGVRAMECVAAGCANVIQCPGKEHPPVYHCAPKVLDAAKELGAAGKNEDGVAEIAAMVARYIPLMHVMWPAIKGDADMMQVLDAMQAWSG